MKPASRTRVRRVMGNVALVTISLFASVLLAEVLIRSFYPQKLSLNVSQWDPYVGFTNIPGLRGSSATSDFVMHVTINSHGLRDREFAYAKPRHVFRVGLFGDSFTFGEGVQNDEAYPKVLEGLLNGASRPAGTTIEVLNFGVGKSGTSHQLALFRKEGTKYDLDLVILGFLARNDFTDNWGGVFYLKDDSLVHNPGAYSTVRRIQRVLYAIPGYKWAATRSHLVNLFRKTATIIDDRARTKRAARFNDMGTRSGADTNLQHVRLTEKLIEAFNREAHEQGADFLLINLPDRGQRPALSYDAREPAPAYVSDCEELLSAIRQQNIPVLDLVPDFSTLPVATHFFANDAHMTPLGHQAIAHRLYQYLIENRMVPVP
jgi:acetyltransferase AlgX (SGNH hydrolase-like protein)